jgi:K+-transporting ATPase KdpF subunit
VAEACHIGSAFSLRRGERFVAPARGEHSMTPQTVVYTLAAIVAGALLVYLLIALLKPEWFQ